jgi:hypothetical protein
VGWCGLLHRAAGRQRPRRPRLAARWSWCSYRAHPLGPRPGSGGRDQRAASRWRGALPACPALPCSVGSVHTEVVWPAHHPLCRGERRGRWARARGRGFLPPALQVPCPLPFRTYPRRWVDPPPMKRTTRARWRGYSSGQDRPHAGASPASTPVPTAPGPTERWHRPTAPARARVVVVEGSAGTSNRPPLVGEGHHSSPSDHREGAQVPGGRLD